MRKTKEERIIAHGDSILEELHRVYLEGIGIDEYHKLLDEYKKLYRRYEKTIKLSDNMGNTIMDENDNLNDNLQYTIKTARNKLLENVTEHKKTKDASHAYKEKIHQYEKELDESANRNIKLQKKLNYYIKRFGEVNHQFNEEVTLDNSNKNSSTGIEINPVEYRNMSIKNVLSLELAKEKSVFILMKIKLKEFGKMQETIEQNSSITNFIKGTYKFIQNSFHKDCIVFHDELETFYLISKNEELNELKMLATKLSKKRSVYNFSIDFFIGMTKYIDGNDTVDILLKRCDSALEDSIQSGNIVVK